VGDGGNYIDWRCQAPVALEYAERRPSWWMDVSLALMSLDRATVGEVEITPRLAKSLTADDQERLRLNRDMISALFINSFIQRQLQLSAERYSNI
jgi:hypothetical protein